MSDEKEGDARLLLLITYHSSLITFQNHLRHLLADARGAARVRLPFFTDRQRFDILARGDATEAAFAHELLVHGGPAPHVDGRGGDSERRGLAVHRAARAHHEVCRGY